MANITVKYTIKLKPGMGITLLEANDAQKRKEDLPINNGEINGEISFYTAFPYFEFYMEGVGTIIAINTEGSVNFTYNGKKVLASDATFVVKPNGTIRLYLPKVLLPA
ncbi:MAG: hypothetical protein JSS82_10120 [Bacteroidetes bacterium]|nr:hypothetical protein [Bacteroidota bacterium]